MASKYQIKILSKKTGGKITENQNLMSCIPVGELSEKILNAARYGTPMLKIGEKSPKIMITAGIHGNELPPQIAALWLVEELLKRNIDGTVYLIPFAIPEATMNNSRRFKGMDMNRKASDKGSASYKIIKAAESIGVASLADFHATKPRSNPGIESVFCSKKPCKESMLIGKYITNSTSSKMICHEKAGALYNGALEDECNLRGTAAVTCEVLSENCEVRPGSPERSYNQMLTYLKYFGII